MTVLGKRAVWRLTLDSGETLEPIVSDQRDWVALETAQADGEVKGAITSFRYIVWHAAKRAGLLRLDWDQFGRDVVEVERLDDEPEDEQREGEPDGRTPGRPEVTDGS